MVISGVETRMTERCEMHSRKSNVHAKFLNNKEKELGEGILERSPKQKDIIWRGALVAAGNSRWQEDRMGRPTGGVHSSLNAKWGSWSHTGHTEGSFIVSRRERHDRTCILTRLLKEVWEVSWRGLRLSAKRPVKDTVLGIQKRKCVDKMRYGACG